MSDPKKLAEIKASKAKYDENVAKVLQKMPERRADFVNTSGIPIARVYTPLDMADFDYMQKLGFPGQYPYTRAVQPTMYRGRFWTMRQYAGFGTAEETNERYHFLLKSGQTGLSVAFDLPTQIGYDSDHPLALGEVGKVGVAIDSLADMERLFEGIPLDKVSTSMTINSPGAVLLAMYLAVAEKQGVTLGQAAGHHPERHSEGIFLPGHLHLPAPALHADHHRHLRVLHQGSAPLEHHQHQRLPHPGSRLHRGAGSRLHPGQRHRLRGGGHQGGHGGG